MQITDMGQAQTLLANLKNLTIDELRATAEGLESDANQERKGALHWRRVAANACRIEMGKRA